MSADSISAFDGRRISTRVVCVSFPRARLCASQLIHVSIAVIGIALMTASSDASCDERARFGRAVYETARYPVAMATADLNGDGLVDLVTTNGFDSPISPGSISVLTGLGGGVLSEPELTEFGFGFGQHAIGDLDGDTIPDLVIPDSGNWEIHVLLGNGDGTFGEPVTTNNSGPPTVVAILDYDGDGIADVVSNDRRSNGGVNLLHGVGDGTFDDASTSYPTGNLPNDLVIADFDLDKIIDIAVVHAASSQVRLLFGNPDGTFDNGAVMAIGTSVRTMATEDFNGDGAPDLVLTDFTDPALHVLIGNGAGDFFPEVTYPLLTPPHSVAAVDADGDDVVDLAVGAATAGVLFGAGDGTFGAITTYAANERVSELIADDTDGDGAPELLACNTVTRGVCIFRNAGDGTFGVLDDWSHTFDSIALLIHHLGADMNGDGRTDLILSTDPIVGVFGEVNVLLSQGDGTARLTDTKMVFGAGVTATAAGDFDADGAVDLASSIDVYSGIGQINLYRGQNDGTFLPGGSVTLPAGITHHLDLATADLNADGILDLVATNEASGITAYLGTGALTFGAGVFHATGAATSIDLADLNGDGFSDAVVGRNDAGRVEILLGNGDGTFTDHAAYVVPDATFISVAVGELSGDDADDLVVTGGSSETVQFYRGAGNGSFFASGTWEFWSNTSSPVIADYDGDGHNDIAIADGERWGVTVIFGTGAGSFSPPRMFGLAERAGWIVAEDFDENGSIDLAFARSLVPPDGVPQVRIVRSRCEIACLEDLDGSGAIDFNDVLAVLADWGTCVDCPSDLDGNDNVDFTDLLLVLAAWGPCG